MSSRTLFVKVKPGSKLQIDFGGHEFEYQVPDGREQIMVTIADTHHVGDDRIEAASPALIDARFR